MSGYNPKYPIFILSKGRSESRLTAKSLEKMGVNYTIVVEDSEYDDYAAVIHPSKVMALPTDFRSNKKWAIPDDNGQIGGSIPVRNFIWDYATDQGYKRHWILDDNIREFYRINRNVKARVANGTTFRCCEDFTDRYTNVPMSGMNYQFFVPKDQGKPPYYLNTRVYSCILLSNEINHRWRGRYNEDTDLSLRILKDGYCTILFNAFTCGKTATMVMSGGNTEEVYNQGNEKEFDNRYTFAKSLYDQHPDCVKITQKWGRWHHHVDYDRFRLNKLQYRDDFVLPEGRNEYGMVLGKYRTKEEMKNAEGYE